MKRTGDQYSWTTLVIPGVSFRGFLDGLARVGNITIETPNGAAAAYLRATDHRPALVSSSNYKTRIHSILPRRTRVSVEELCALYRSIWTLSADEQTLDAFASKACDEHSICCGADRRTGDIFIGGRNPKKRSPVAAAQPQNLPAITCSDEAFEALVRQVLEFYVELSCLFIPADDFSIFWSATRRNPLPIADLTAGGPTPDVPGFLELLARRSDVFEFFHIASGKKDEGRTPFFGPLRNVFANAETIHSLDDFAACVHLLVPPNTRMQKYAMMPLYSRVWHWTASDTTFRETLESEHFGDQQDGCCLKRNPSGKRDPPYTIDVRDGSSADRFPLVLRTDLNLIPDSVVPLAVESDRTASPTPARFSSHERDAEARNRRSLSRESLYDSRQRQRDTNSRKRGRSHSRERRSRSRSSGRKERLYSHRSRDYSRDYHRLRDRSWDHSPPRGTRHYRDNSRDRINGPDLGYESLSIPNKVSKLPDKKRHDDGRERGLQRLSSAISAGTFHRTMPATQLLVSQRAANQLPATVPQSVPKRDQISLHPSQGVLATPIIPSMQPPHPVTTPPIPATPSTAELLIARPGPSLPTTSASPFAINLAMLPHIVRFASQSLRLNRKPFEFVFES